MIELGTCVFKTKNVLKCSINRSSNQIWTSGAGNIYNQIVILLIIGNSALLFMFGKSWSPWAENFLDLYARSSTAAIYLTISRGTILNTNSSIDDITDFPKANLIHVRKFVL